MVFFADLPDVGRAKSKAQPRLNTLVDAAPINLRKMNRDFPRWNNTYKADEVIAALPFRVRKALGADARKAPYLAHAAYAATQSPLVDDDEVLTRLRLELTAGKHTIQVELEDPRVRYLAGKYGRADAHSVVKWVAAEQEARNTTYGTNGIFWREWFSDRLRHFRTVLECPITPPVNWVWLVPDMIESGLLKASYRHHAHGKIYPSYGLLFDRTLADAEYSSEGSLKKGSRRVYKPK